MADAKRKQALTIVGEHAPEAVLEYASPSNPMAVARQLLPAWQLDDCLTLRHWRGTWMRWERTHWAEVDDREIRSMLYQRLENATYIVVTKDGDEESRPWAPTKRKIADLLEAKASIVHLPASVHAPSWSGAAPVTDGPIVACTNGLLHVADRKLLDLDPRFFNLVSVPFPFDEAAPAPEQWLQFLADLWPDDPDSIAVLQEFFGYVLSGRTDLHKILLIVGPTRSGKGTIARVLAAMVGKPNVAGPTLASMCTNFGLSPLLGKPLATISDARLSGRDTQSVVERLLTISGEDTIDVDRKHRDPWTGRLPTRFLILSNELPNFGDASGTIAHRFVVLTMQTSWLGRENTALEDQLTAELPGILNWALDGLARLAARGRFTEPASSVEAVTSMKDTASPTSAFVRERCVVGPAHEILVDDLFAAWKSWCEQNERRVGNKQVFGRNLRSVVPQIRSGRPREDGRHDRTYVGIDLAPPRTEQAWPCSGESSGPPRTNTPNEPVVRGGPDENPLRAQHSTDAATCVGCGAPLLLADPDRTLCERCRLDGRAAS